MTSPLERTTLNRRVKAGSQVRRASARDSIRQSILQAAGQLLLDSGYDAFSLRKVAERVGYTATAIYRHFSDKDALLYAVTEEPFRLFTDRLRSAAGESADPFAALEAMAMAYIDFGLEHRVWYQVMLLYRPDLLWRRFPEGAGSRMDSFGVLRAAVRAAVATGRTLDRDVLAISNALWAQTHGAVSLALAMPHVPHRQVRAFAALGATAFVRGVQRAD